MSLLRTAYNTLTSTPGKSNFCFQNKAIAAKLNTSTLANHNFDLQAAISADNNSICNTNSEFRHKSVTFPLFDLHKNGDKLKDMYTHGIQYPIQDTYPERKSDLNKAILESNNGSARGKDEFIAKSYDKEVSRGWMIPILKQTLSKLQGAGRIKIGVATQTTVNPDGSRRTKHRLTHDCSQPQHSGKSVNLLCDRDKLEQIRCSRALFRTMLMLHALRHQHPSTPLLLGKFDMDSAYRRCFVWLRHALLCCTIIGELAYILLRLPFGSSPAAGAFSLLSDFVADLAQQLVDDNTWDPDTFKSDIVSDIPMVQTPPLHDISTVKQLQFDIPTRTISIDVFIDDFIAICLYSISNVKRAFHAVPLVLDCIFRPTTDNESVERAPILAKDKLLAEGTLKIRQRILGWILDTHQMKLFVPQDKVDLIMDILHTFSTMAKQQTKLNTKHRKQLESLIGKLQDIALMVPEGRFFLNRLRYRHKASGRHDSDKAKNRLFDNMELQDLQLWMDILPTIGESGHGRSFDHILPVKYDFVCISDASEHAVGGYFFIGDTAYAWRFELPPKWRGLFTLNLLEFIAAYYTLHKLIWLIRAVSNLNFRVFALTDSTNALSWQHRNNFNPHLQPAHDIVSRAFARTLLHNKVSVTPDHVTGKENIIADCMSRDTNHQPDQLCRALLAHPEASKLLPKNLQIFEQNGEDLSYFLQSLAVTLPPKELTPNKPGRSTLGLGIDGKAIYNSVESHTISFCNQNQVAKVLRSQTSSSALPTSCDTTGLLQTMGKSSQPPAFDNTLETYVRHSWIKDSTTPPEYLTEN